MRSKVTGALLLTAAMVLPIGLSASPAGAVGGTVCKTASGTATFTPGLPKAGSPTKVTPTVKIAGAKVGGCVGGTVTAGTLSATLKFHIGSNCSSLNKSGNVYGPLKIVWAAGKGTSNIAKATLALGGSVRAWFGSSCSTDLLGRLIADQFKTGLEATVIVENKPGAGTTLGADQVAKSEPDGYTLLMATSTTLAINKTLYKKLPYDPVKDFAPIGLVAGVPFALIINPSIPAKSLAEFIAYAKSKPGLAYGSAGNGSPQHLGAEMLKTAAGIDIRHVPYRGSVPAMLDVIAGHIPFMVVDLQPALQQIREGKVQGARRDHAASGWRPRPISRPSPKAGLPASNWSPGRAWWRPPAHRGRSSTNWPRRSKN